MNPARRPPDESDELRPELETIHQASFGWALICCRWNHDAAEEVLQASYLKALDGSAQYDGLSTLRTWFFGVVRRTASEQRRRNLMGDMAVSRWFRRRPLPCPVPTPEDLTDEVATQRRLREQLARLSGRQRELLHLVFYQELTIEQAAAVLGIGVGSARTHYARGKARLRTLLTGPGVTDEDSRRRQITSRTV